MDYTNKVVKISALVLFVSVILTLGIHALQNWGVYGYWTGLLIILFFLYPVPFTFIYFRKYSGKNVGVNLLLLTLNIFTVMGLYFKYYIYPLTH
jgi:hypothetical protein